jgi:hypothetical protein
MLSGKSSGIRRHVRNLCPRPSVRTERDKHRIRGARGEELTAIASADYRVSQRCVHMRLKRAALRSLTRSWTAPGGLNPSA